MPGKPGALTIFLSDVKPWHDVMVELVERMLDPSASSGQALNKRLPKVRTPHEQESLKRTIEATDDQIDSLVDESCGLTKDEIAIVEGRRRTAMSDER